MNERTDGRTKIDFYNFTFSITGEIMTDKSCAWAITINNPTEDDITKWQAMASLPWVREVSGQLEKGEGGTLHIQGMLRTQSVRFAQVKRELPRAHIEAAKSPAALARYVAKSETRVAAIPRVRTATQADIQREVRALVRHQMYLWEQEQEGASFDLTTWDEKKALLRYAWRIRREWEHYVDDAVRRLMCQGYYGIEFVMSNPQVRTAFRKYIVEICYRHARQEGGEDQQEGQAIGEENHQGS